MWPDGRATPIKEVKLQVADRRVPLLLKLEGANTTGSIKYRTAVQMVDALEQEGRLRRGSTLIESTSGNLGVALASLCAERGYRFVAVVDPKAPTTCLERMDACGAHVQMVSEPDENGGFLLSRLSRVAEICRSEPDVAWTNQYSNPANPAAHYLHTAPEILQQTGGRIDSIFVAVSTGGTLAGIARYLREHAPTITIIAVDAVGSVVFAPCPAPRLLNGIGSSRRSEFLVPDLYDAHVLVGDEEAFAFCRALRARTGLAVGGSSGAVVAACVRVLTRERRLSRPLCLCADDGGLYADTIFDEEWLTARGLAGVMRRKQAALAAIIDQ